MEVVNGPSVSMGEEQRKINKLIFNGDQYPLYNVFGMRNPDSLKYYESEAETCDLENC